LIAIVDYGMGNLKSVRKALSYLDIESVITSEAKGIAESTGIIVPGVGAFPDAMQTMKSKGLDRVIIEEASKGKPILGICLGMQLLFEESYEIEKCHGLGLLKGSIVKIDESVKVPHMGWNDLKLEKECELFKEADENSFVYFVHSYYAKPAEEGIVNAYASYGGKVPAIVSKDNIYGIQFHPEKSGEAGIRILKRFGEMVR
jgi:imidazole glycerol-phosphate synthase subunit HisH